MEEWIKRQGEKERKKVKNVSPLHISKVVPSLFLKNAAYIFCCLSHFAMEMKKKNNGILISKYFHSSQAVAVYEKEFVLLTKKLHDSLNLKKRSVGKRISRSYRQVSWTLKNIII